MARLRRCVSSLPVPLDRRRWLRHLTFCGSRRQVQGVLSLEEIARLWGAPGPKYKAR